MYIYIYFMYIYTFLCLCFITNSGKCIEFLLTCLYCVEITIKYRFQAGLTYSHN